MKLTLYINDRAADLGTGTEEALVLWTYTRDDADAPAAVKNSYTKTVTLPASDANAAIFGHAGTLDRVTAAGMFDTLQRNPFIIYADDGRVLDRGYLKIDRIARRGETVLSYDVTLYGGLGGFFYALTYKADGSKRSLADMRWATTSEQPTTADLIDLWDPTTAPDNPDVEDGWADLIDGSYVGKLTGIVNYVPANNGIPDGDFDAGKAYVQQQSHASTGGAGYNLGGVETRVTKDGVTYTGPQAGGLGVILDLGGKFTEWETQCFVPEQQRMAWNLARFLFSLQVGSLDGDFGGWKFYLDEQSPFFDGQVRNPYFWDTWVTLEPTNPGPQRYMSFTLQGTKTPADYLLGFAKTFGLVFVVDEVAQTITLTTRNQYYAGGADAGVIDLSDRVETHGETAAVRPFLASARMYRFAAKTAGAFAEDYAGRYGRTYGDFLLDSGFTFDAGEVDVMKSSPFQGVADVLENSPWYMTLPDPDEVGVIRPYVKFVEYGTVTYQLVAAGTNKTLKVEVPSVRGDIPYVTGHRGVAALPQFHDESGKRTKAADVLLFLNGSTRLPHNGSPYINAWHIGSGGVGEKGCWDLSLADRVIPVTEIPLFQRWTSAGQDRVFLDYGEPEQVADGREDQQGDAYVYEQFWSNYMTDRFDRDTMVLTIRVDLSGLTVGPSLLRRFFWYRGSLWSLNKITDYNPARPGLTKCEFVRVQDIRNYTEGQTIPNA